MGGFFAKRAETYDEHMLSGVEGCSEGYRQMARLLPDSAECLLDLGCGTGLELGEIFKTKPNLRVTGIDLAGPMLDRLRRKYPDKNLTLLEADYLSADFGEETFDAAVSFETMHHFSHAEKIGLYEKIRRALRPGGRYIESDYMVTDQKEEDFLYAENARLRREQNIPEGALYHFDTPCTVDNQLAMLRKAGFEKVEAVWREGNTTIVVAQR